MPVGVGMNQVEFVASAEVFVFVFVAQHVVAMQYGCLVYQISASLVQSHRIGGGQDAKVGDDGGVIMIPAITLGRYVHHKAYVEVRFVFQDGLGIFGYLVIHVFRGIPTSYNGGIVLA